MGRRESLHAWAGHQHSGHQYQDWSQQQPTTQEYWHDPQQGHSQHYSQQSAATQHWHVQQQQQMQQQLPALPNPVYPPGMQPIVQPPPGLASNVQRTRQGVMTQGASMQYGSAASRQQSPAGSQPPQDRQQSSYSQQYPSTGGYFRQGYQWALHPFHWGGVFWHVKKRVSHGHLVWEQLMNECPIIISWIGGCVSHWTWTSTVYTPYF